MTQKNSFWQSTLRIYAQGIMLVDSLIGLGLFIAGEFFPAVASTMIISPPIASLLGLLASWWIYRANKWGWWLAFVFYALQIPSYYSGQFRFSLQAGLNFSEVVTLPHGILVLNYLGIVGVVMTGAILLSSRKK